MYSTWITYPSHWSLRWNHLCGLGHGFQVLDVRRRAVQPAPTLEWCLSGKQQARSALNVYNKQVIFISYRGMCTFLKLLFGLHRGMEYIRIQDPSLPVPYNLLLIIVSCQFLLLTLFYLREVRVALTDVL